MSLCRFTAIICRFGRLNKNSGSDIEVMANRAIMYYYGYSGTCSKKKYGNNNSAQ